jgi:3-phosphoshikimate 1-carboxyvinyltransferase
VTPTLSTDLSRSIPGGFILKRILQAAYGPLSGDVSVPGDKSISHRAALFALLADGPCRASGWLESQDTLSSLQAIQDLGVQVSLQDGCLELLPPARTPLLSGSVTVDCGNSGTTARLLCGLLAGWLPVEGGEVRLTGDASLSCRPMGRVVVPLRSMGASIEHLGKDGFLPLRIRGAQLNGASCDLDVPSAQVKSALLLAAINAEGKTTIRGAGSSRDHTERLLATMGLDVCGFPGAGDLSLEGPLQPGSYNIQVPADPSSAAFFQVAAALVPGSCLTVKNQSLNKGRAGFLEVLQKAGAAVVISNRQGAPGEEMGDVQVSPGDLQGFCIEAPEIPALIDELPILAVLATRARGTSLITGAEDLRVKECDRLAAMTRALSQLGADIEELPDGWRINGPTSLRGGPSTSPVVIETRDDHRIAMALAVAALVSEGTTVLDDDACVGVSYPNFFQTLAQLLNRS